MTTNVGIRISAQDDTGKAFATVRQNLSGMQKDAASAGGAFAGMADKIGPLAASLAAAYSVGSLVAYTQATIDAADAMNDMSQRVGIAVGDLAKYQLAADQSGTSMEAVAKGIKGMAANLVEHGAALKKAGIDATSADAAMMQLADVFAAMPDGMEKTTLATKMFGKAGMDLIPMLNLGSKGLATAAEKSAEYALQMAALAPLADAFNDNLGELSLASKTFGMTMANQLMPTLISVSGEMLDSKNGTNALAEAMGKGLNTVLETSIVLLSDVGFVVKGVGREIGALAAQYVAFMSLDFKGFSAIGDAVKFDAEKARAELDAFQARVLAARSIAAQPVVGTYAQRSGVGYKAPADAAAVFAAVGAAEKSGRAAKSAADEFAKLNAEIARSGELAAEQLSSGNGLAESDRYRIEMLNKLIGAYTSGKITLSQYIDLESEMTDVENTKRQIEELKAALKISEDRAALRKKEYEDAAAFGLAQTDLYNAQVKGAEEALAAAQAEYAQYGLSKAQIAEITLLTLQSTQAKYQDGSEGYAAVQKQIDAQRALIGVLKNTEGLEAAKKVADAWQQTANSISNDLTDAFMGAITNGESLFENLARSVEKMFSDMVLRPVVEAVVSGTLGTSVTGTAGTSLLSGGLSMSSLGQSASSLAGAFNGSGLGSFATSSMGASLGLSKTVEAVGPALEGAAAPTMNTLTGAGEALSSLPIGGILTAYEIGGVGGFAAGVASTAIAGAIGTLGTATSAMAGATAALGALGPVGWIGLGLAAVLGAGNDSIPSYNTGDSNLTFGTDGVLKTASTEYGNSEASAAYAAGLQGSYAAAIEALGATMAETNFVTGSNSGKEASDPQLVFASSVNGQSYQSAETQAADTAAVELAASRAVFNALQASEMPDYLAGVFDGITASTATQEQITAAIEGAAALKGFHDQLQLMPWDSLKDMTYATTQALVDLSGGLDKLESNLGTYYDKFYTDSEKTSDLTAATADAFAALGITMPTATDGLRDWYRGLVDSVLALDQSDAANAGATVAVLALQTAVDTLAPTFEDAAKAIAEYQSWQDKLDVLNGVTTERAQQQAADLAAASDEATRALINQVYAAEDLATLRQSAMDAVSTAIDAAIGQAEAGKDAAQSAYDALAEDIQAALDPVADSISKLQSLSTSLKGTLDSMALAGSDGIARSAAQGQISAALGTARSTGALPLDGQLDNALRTVAQPSEKLFATFTDYARDFYKTANDIAALADLTGTQLSADEAMQSTLDQQLDQAKESFDAQTAYFDSQIKAYEDQAKYAQELFDATTTGTLSVVDAITALQEAMKPGSTGTKNTANGGAEGIMGDAGDVWGTGYINNNKKPDNVSSYYGGFFDGYLDNVDAAKSAITGLDWSDPGAAINQLWQAQQESGGTLSNSVLSGASGFTQAEIEAMFASQGLQSFAVGTNYVPNDMIAQIHKGEAIIPAPYNPANGGSQDNGAMLAKLDAMLTRLERIESSNADIAGYTRRTDSTLIRVTRGGEQMQVSAA